ncbi:hypothetical protein YpB42003004_4154 [Yersinia pestis biovar Antiqua str. B42003004]|nr:hypothetical protein YpAngola_A0854 [Yersinia pestis Angola]EDR44386.1 hypothetical protein YpE1979001_3183 [Yersinia pestis biovar Antiqua str. E1979001]EDR51135.1 hypothetical protein YpB42003004_4154 [Yersinia pestis biovar Antiqua str. B42003004]EDR59073.1 hypothetical protein YpMG051020_2217 [Yersinia pestis biovar Orientalis str. MG05-1020]EDR64810.1 hypothetical protein YpK1973002_3326 [Yersinia pestis biovar Mediaevalis str. K1973002]EFA47283.1 conserved hypothetical protein [Yersin
MRLLTRSVSGSPAHSQRSIHAARDGGEHCPEAQAGRFSLLINQAS